MNIDFIADGINCYAILSNIPEIQPRAKLGFVGGF
jgi:hypothetical protein